MDKRRCFFQEKTFLHLVFRFPSHQHLLKILAWYPNFAWNQIFRQKVRLEFLNRTKIILGVLMSSPQSVTRIMDHELDRKYKQTDIDYYFKDIEHGWSPGIGTGFYFYLIFIFQLQEKIGKGEFGDVRLGVYNGNKVSNSTSRNKNIKKDQNWWILGKIFPSFSKNYNYGFW